MEQLGSYLRSIREEKKLTKEYVNNDIKITLDQIDCIENNRLNSLGSYGYARALVYTYARYLEADEQVVFQLFSQIMPSQKKDAFVPQSPIKEKKLLISINFIWLVSIFVIVIALGSILWVSYTRGYLRRPFDKLAHQTDSVKIAKKTIEVIEKPDTLRKKMLEITQNTKSVPTQAINSKKKNIRQTIAASDSFDYVEEMIFEGRDSPFNARF